jgi:FkbM family methyltransferase
LSSTDVPPKNAYPPYAAADWFLRNALRHVPVTVLTEKIALWWGYRFRPAPRVVKLRSGGLLRLANVDYLQLLLYYLGIFEPHCIRFLSRSLRPGDTLLDVGANIGLFTVEGARLVGQEGHVIAIEAMPQMADLVRSQVAINGFKNVQVVPAAVGDQDGTATLTRPRDANAGMFTLGNVDGEERFDVPVRRIDDILAGRAISFIKMDIEGSEYRALLGAEQTLRRFHPTILVELNESALNGCGTSSKAVKTLLAGFGYTGRILNRDGSMTDLSMDQTHDCDECVFVYDSSSQTNGA